MNADVVRRLWASIQARDWAGVASVLHPDVVIDWPHTGERIRGRDNYVAVQREYPEGWSLSVARILADADVVVSEVRVDHGQHVFHGSAFYEITGGRIGRGTEYWLTARGEAPPAWRRKWTDSV